MIFDRHANLKYKYGNGHFWRRGYYVDTVGRNAKAIEEYVKNQLMEDIATGQLSLKKAAWLRGSQEARAIKKTDPGRG